MQSLNQLLVTVSNILEEIIMETDSTDSTIQTLFHTKKVPAISIKNYIQRIAKYANCSEQCFIVALIYLDKLQEANSNLVLTSNCIHRFVMISIIMAIKFLDDDYYKNEYYARVAGISLQEMNSLEKTFLEMLDYNIYVNPTTYQLYERKLAEYNKINEVNDLVTVYGVHL